MYNIVRWVAPVCVLQYVRNSGVLREKLIRFLNESATRIIDSCRIRTITQCQIQFYDRIATLLIGVGDKDSRCIRDVCRAVNPINRITTSNCVNNRVWIQDEDWYLTLFAKARISIHISNIKLKWIQISCRVIETCKCWIWLHGIIPHQWICRVSCCINRFIDGISIANTDRFWKRCRSQQTCTTY